MTTTSAPSPAADQRPPAASEPTRSADRDMSRAADRVLVDTIRQGRWWVMLMAAAEIAVAATGLLLPAALAVALDAVLAGGPVPPGPLLGVAGVLVMGMAATALLEIAQPYSTTVSTVWLRGRLMARILAVGVAGQRRFDAGDLVNRTGSNAATAAAAGSVTVSSVVGLITSVGAVVALFLLHPLLGAVFVVAAPAGLAVLAVFVRRSSTLYGVYQSLQGEVAIRFVDAMGGVRTIRSAGTTDREIRRVLAPLPQLAAAGRGTWHLQGAVTWRMLLLAPLVEVGVLAVAGVMVAGGSLSIGDLIAAAGYTTLGLTFFDQGSILISLSRSRAAARRVAAVFATPPSPPGSGHAVLPDGGGELVMAGVTVRAGEQVVLDRLDLRVPAGASVALVGASGSGKSTVAEVAGWLVEPEAGSVRLDGVELGELDPAELRRAVGYAFERPALLGTTVLDMLGYGLDRPDPERLRQAAVAAHADGFVRRLPAGYATPLADAPFSGGEAQRLGLARAIARGSRLLIMDDATSSLDTVTELQVSRAIERSLAGCSRLVVAHRAGTAARADLVAWLVDGRLRALAPHARLWTRPDYRAIFAAEGAES